MILVEGLDNWIANLYTKSEGPNTLEEKNSTKRTILNMFNIKHEYPVDSVGNNI